MRLEFFSSLGNALLGLARVAYKLGLISIWHKLDALAMKAYGKIRMADYNKSGREIKFD